MTMKPKTPDTPRQVTLILWTALATLALLAPLVGCKSTPATPPTQYVLVTSFAGYHIHASLDRPASLDSSDDGALIAFSGHRLRVEKGWVVLDNNERAAFPSAAKVINIVVSQGTLTMTADGKEMWKRPMPAE